MTAKVFLKARKARPLFHRHPWLFERAIARIEGRPQAGDVVQVVSDERKFVAWGLFSPKSRIRVRLYSWEESRPIDETLLVERLKDAASFRRDVLGLSDPRGACRVAFSESDGLSGLIVDRFADVVVLQPTSAALARYEPAIVEASRELFGPAAIVRRVDPAIAEREGMTLGDEVLAGAAPCGPTEIEESGVTFRVDPVGGQKTGAFLDQRDNRLAAARYARDRNVLDVFCYTGGFGLVALARGGACSVLGVDSSADALDLAKENAAPFGSAVEYRRGDAAAVMTELRSSCRQFGMVVCDPPKFAHRSADVAGAMHGYEYINRLAISLVEPGGVLVTCSCSGLVTPEMFLAMLRSASNRERRELRLLEVRGQAADHPVSLWCPETAYLKCVLARVMG